jgi:hypothetical protein
MGDSEVTIMRRTIPLLLALAVAPLLSGCLAKTALDVATAPVKIASKAADMATTSQSEADEKRGRALRKREERLGHLERRYWKLDQPCRSGDSAACAEQDAIGDEMAALRPTVPAQ